MRWHPLKRKAEEVRLSKAHCAYTVCKVRKDLRFQSQNDTKQETVLELKTGTMLTLWELPER